MPKKQNLYSELFLAWTVLTFLARCVMKCSWITGWMTLFKILTWNFTNSYFLGAEKALFRALKKKGNTPKYGLIFHSSFIGRAAAKNKGRISRFLANKCSIASRIDCFAEHATNIFGSKLKEQVEDRLKFFETGDIPKKNMDVMNEALETIKKEESKCFRYNFSVKSQHS